MTPRLEELLREIEERVNAATEGPWDVEYQNFSYLISNDDQLTYFAQTELAEDAEFIVHAGTDIPRLLKVVKVLSEGILRIDKWTIHPNDVAIDQNFSQPGCRLFIKDRCSEALSEVTKILGGES